MQRLSIPLSRTVSTTRRNRRVVWLLAGFGGILLVTACVSAAWWWNRDTITDQVPDGTVAYIRFTPNKRNWEEISTFLSSIPLISSRSLTTNDIAPWLRGEFALLFSEDGSHALAIRTGKEGPPRELLDAHSIVAQETGTNTYILSDRLLPLSERPWSSGWHFPKILPFPKKLGTFAMTEMENVIGGDVLQTKNGIALRTKAFGPYSQEILSYPATTFAVVSTQVLPNEVLPAAKIADVLLSGLEIPAASWVATTLAQEPEAWFILTSDESSMHYLLNLPNKTQEDGRDLIRGIAALHQPETRTWTLPDQSQATELVVDPSSVTVEEFTTGGKLVYRTTAGENTFFSAPFDTGILISDNQSVLDYYLHGNTSRTSGVFCADPIFATNIRTLNSFFSNTGIYRSGSLLSALSQNTTSIVLKKDLFSQSLLFCE